MKTIANILEECPWQEALLFVLDSWSLEKLFNFLLSSVVQFCLLQRVLENNGEDEVLHISEHSFYNASGSALRWSAASSLYLDSFVSGLMIVLSPL